MPVIINRLHPGNNGLTGYATAKVLAAATIDQFNAVRNTGTGIGPASCCAAVAVTPTIHFPALPAQAFGVCFGNSRVAASGLDQGPVGGHAERCALTAAGNNALALPATAVLFVELAPCPGCATWLGGGGGGVANPFGFGALGATLHVWYAFDYPAGVGAMETFHGQSVANQHITAAAW